MIPNVAQLNAAMASLAVERLMFIEKISQMHTEMQTLKQKLELADAEVQRLREKEITPCQTL